MKQIICFIKRYEYRFKMSANAIFLSTMLMFFIGCSPHPNTEQIRNDMIGKAIYDEYSGNEIVWEFNSPSEILDLKIDNKKKNRGLLEYDINIRLKDINGNIYRSRASLVYRKESGKWQLISIFLRPTEENGDSTDLELFEDIYTRRAEHLITKEDWSRLLDISQYWTSQQPKNYLAWHSKCAASHQMGMTKESIEYCKQAIDINPTFASFYLLGVSYSNLGMYGMAIEAFEESIKLEPNHSTTYVDLAFVYRILERYEDALKVLKKSIEIESEDPYVYLELGKNYLDLESYNTAVKECNQALGIKTDIPEAHHCIGSAYYELNKHKRAIEAMKEAIKLNPDIAKYYNILGLANYSLKKYTEALEAHKQSIRLNPRIAASYNNLANVYLSLQRYEETMEAYKKSIQLKPDDPYPHYGLGIAYNYLGDKVSALKEYQILRELDVEFANKLFDSIY